MENCLHRRETMPFDEHSFWFRENKQKIRAYCIIVGVARLMILYIRCTFGSISSTQMAWSMAVRELRSICELPQWAMPRTSPAKCHRCNDIFRKKTIHTCAVRAHFLLSRSAIRSNKMKRPTRHRHIRRLDSSSRKNRTPCIIICIDVPCHQNAGSKCDQKYLTAPNCGMTITNCVIISVDGTCKHTATHISSSTPSACARQIFPLFVFILFHSTPLYLFFSPGQRARCYGEMPFHCNLH